MAATKGLGTYGNAVGVVTPIDHKAAQAGQVVKATATTIRAGLFWPGTGTIISGTASMSYDVIAYGCVSQRSAAAGAVFGGNDGTLNVVTTAAPGANSRIDIVYHWNREFTLDGTDSNPVIAVIQGAAAASPVAPSLAAFPGAIEIGRATVGAGITATTSATITQTALFTAMAGGVVPFRTTTERDAGTFLEGQLGWLVDTDALQVYSGTAWAAVGNKNVIPSSVTNGSVTTAGVVTSTAQTLVRVVTAFPTTWRVFRVTYDVVMSGATGVNVLFAVGATDATAANYTNTRTTFINGAVATTATGAVGVAEVSAIGVAGARHVGTFEITNPNIADPTHYLGASTVTSAGAITATTGGVEARGVHSLSTIYDSLTLTASVGTVTVTRLTIEGVS